MVPLLRGEDVADVGSSADRGSQTSGPDWLTEGWLVLGTVSSEKYKQHNKSDWKNFLFRYIQNNASITDSEGWLVPCTVSSVRYKQHNKNV